jgi:hypothetical protein
VHSLVGEVNMTETTLDILARRLDGLERENRYQRLLMATILVAVMTRVTLGILDERPGLTFADTDGRVTWKAP